MNKRPKPSADRRIIRCCSSAYLQQILTKISVRSSQRRPAIRHLSLQYQSGLSFVEVMVTLLLISLLVVMAVPSSVQLRQYYERAALERVAQQMLQEGRNIAFSFRQRIIICGSRYGTTCDDADWSHGMLMFQDTNFDNRFTPEIDIVLRFEPINLQYGTWRWRGGVSAPNFVRFEHTSGMPHASFGSFHYCDFEQKHLFRLVMRNTGVLRKDDRNVRC